MNTRPRIHEQLVEHIEARVWLALDDERVDILHQFEDSLRIDPEKPWEFTIPVPEEGMPRWNNQLGIYEKHPALRWFAQLVQDCWYYMIDTLIVCDNAVEGIDEHNSEAQAEWVMDQRASGFTDPAPCPHLHHYEDRRPQPGPEPELPF